MHGGKSMGDGIPVYTVILKWPESLTDGEDHYYICTVKAEGWRMALAKSKVHAACQSENGEDLAEDFSTVAVIAGAVTLLNLAGE